METASSGQGTREVTAPNARRLWGSVGSLAQGPVEQAKMRATKVLLWHSSHKTLHGGQKSMSSGIRQVVEVECMGGFEILECWMACISHGTLAHLAINGAVHKAFQAPPTVDITFEKTKPAGSDAEESFPAGIIRWTSRVVANSRWVCNHGGISSRLVPGRALPVEKANDACDRGRSGRWWAEPTTGEDGGKSHYCWHRDGSCCFAVSVEQADFQASAGDVLT
jgi:hypothetical protein